MGASPSWKVYNPKGEYVAACVHVEDAAMIVNGYGNGATIRLGHNKRSTFWTEGQEDQLAGESYDHVAEVVALRLDARAAREA